MGADIHSWTEVRENGTWVAIPYAPFEEYRSYAWFGFLANVRNYSHSPVIAMPRGLPADMSARVKENLEDWGYHSEGWLSLRELLDFDYEQVFWDRRVTKFGKHGWDGAALAEEGEGTHLPLREFLGEVFFNTLEVLQRFGAPDDVRIVFGFDS